MDLDYRKIGEEVKKGSLIIYPTDTVYGIGATIYSEEAIEKIYKAKKRNFKAELIALVSSTSEVFKIASVAENKREIFDKLAEKFWPGALTIILDKKDIVPDIMISSGSTVGLRIPNYKIALDIIRESGGILPTTSANVSGEATPKSYSELSDEIKEKADILIDAGNCPLGEESTIIDLSSKSEKIKILREGAISLKDIESVIGKF